MTTRKKRQNTTQKGSTVSFREKLTSGGKQLILERPVPPVQIIATRGRQIKLTKINVNDRRLRPSNIAKAEGTPLPLLEASGVRIDLSKRKKEPMNFWHRNLDCDEVIFCHKGKIHWETELGNVTLNPGELLVIPKGVAHRSLPPPESEEENIIIELKVQGSLKKLI